MYSHTIKPFIHQNFEVFYNKEEFYKMKDKIKLAWNSTYYFLYESNKAYLLIKGSAVGDVNFVNIPVRESSFTIESYINQSLLYNIFLIVEQNTIIGYVTSATIIESLFKKYEKQKQFIQTILQTSENSYTAIDQDSNVVYWSKGAERLFGIKKESVIGKPITNFFKKENLEILNTLQNKSSVHRHQHQARNDLVVLINSNPVIYDNKTIGAVVSEEDITSQIRLNNELYKKSENLFSLEKEIQKSTSLETPFSHIRGNSSSLRKTKKLTKKAAETDAAVLIHGESGVGKELFAKEIHKIRENENAPYVAINCGAISSNLFESEIFGYEKGAFSGADSKGKKGKAQLAKGGTLFLDEIGEMPFEMQVKFLRLLQEKKFYPVGGTKEVEADFRLIAATNRNLTELIKEGGFREDLFYRLNVVNINIPPLRERPEDIVELTHYFVYEMSIKYNKPIYGISQNIMQSLLKHHWPGNIRELKNIVERMIIFSDNGNVSYDGLPDELENHHNSPLNIPIIDSKNNSKTLQTQLENVERDIIIQQLNSVNGNKAKCADVLGITRATLYNRIKKLNITL